MVKQLNRMFIPADGGTTTSTKRNISEDVNIQSRGTFSLLSLSKTA